LTLELRKAPKGGKLHPEDEKINRIIAMVRAKVEHPFRVLKRQFGYVKTRYRGWPKTAPSSSRCSRSATCFWSEGGCWHKDESVRNLRNRRYGGPEDAKSATNGPYAGPHGNQTDLLGSGTVSGPGKGNRGSLLELSWGGKDPFTLDTGEARSFIEDGDTLTLRGAALGNGFRVGFGACIGTVLAARAP
jgi:hypothetical protein